MLGDSIVGAFLSAIVGTLLGTALPQTWYPFVAVVDDFSAYMSIFNVEKQNIEKEAKIDGKWTWWHSFSLIRNYFTISLFRGIVIQTVSLILNGQIQSFDLAFMIANLNPFFVEASLDLVVILAFYDVIYSNLGKELIGYCATATRAINSIAIFQRFGGVAGSGNLVNMLKFNAMNGAMTLLTYSITDLVFRGSLEKIVNWFGFRLIFFVMPYVHLQFHQTEVPKIHAQFISLIQTQLGSHVGDIHKYFMDSHVMATMAAYFIASYFFTRTTKGLLALVF